MKTADQFEPRAVRWLWRERIPVGMQTIVAGRPGQGKSLFTMKLAAEMSHVGTVIVSFAEDPVREVVRPRLEAAGAKLENVVFERFTFPEDLEYFERLVKETGAILAVFDPVASHLGNGIHVTNHSIRKVSDPMQRIAEETDIAIVWVDHVVKNPSPKAHPLAAIGGSGSGLPAAVRVAYFVGADPEDDERVVIAQVKSVAEKRLAVAYTLDSRPFHDAFAREGSAAFLTPQEGEFPFDARKLIVVPVDKNGNGKTGAPPKKRASACQWLTEYLRAAPNHEMDKESLEEDARQRGITRATLRRAREDMGLEVRSEGKASIWALPQELVEMFDAEDGE